MLERLVEDERASCHAGDELDRTVVVRRPETTRHEAEIGGERLAERGVEVVDAVTDDRYPLRLEPEAHRLGCEERSIAVVPLTPDELRARDDDRRPGSAQAVVRVTCRAVTTKVDPSGNSTRLPFTRTVTLCGARSASWRERPSNDLC